MVQRQSWMAAILAVLLILVPRTPLSGERRVDVPSPNHPCGISGLVPHYRHVVLIVMENAGYNAIIGSPDAPYLNHLSKACGLATNYFAITHPSLPNYIALTAGSNFGIYDDGDPSQHPLDRPNIFSQLRGDWRALEESMPYPCDRVTSDSYAARHNPAVYYTNLASTCARNDIPLRYPLDLNAAFTFVTPNICDDMHSCPVAVGDRWLASFMPKIFSSSLYKKGELVAFITWDESDTSLANRVATIVAAPSVPPGIRVGRAFNHYSLLRTVEQLLGLPPLGGARQAASMMEAFHL
jgi:hypothetical protein